MTDLTMLEDTKVHTALDSGTSVKQSVDSTSSNASFNIGQVVQHRRFNYRGVIIDVDPAFQGSDEWYDTHASDLAPKNRPWYHVIIDEDDVVAYVAEPHIVVDDDDIPVQHPMLENFFSGYDGSKYTTKNTLN